MNAAESFRQLIRVVAQTMLTLEIYDLDLLRLELAKYKYTGIPQDPTAREAYGEIWTAMRTMAQFEDWECPLDVLDKFQQELGSEFDSEPSIETLRRAAEGAFDAIP